MFVVCIHGRSIPGDPKRAAEECLDCEEHRRARVARVGHEATVASDRPGRVCVARRHSRRARSDRCGTGAADRAAGGYSGECEEAGKRPGP